MTVGYWTRRLLVVSGVAGLVAAASLSGLTEHVTDREAAEELLTDSGPVGPALFVVVFALTHPVGLPSVALTFAAGLVWPAPSAVLLSWAGGMVGTFVAFWFGRWVGRDWVSARLPARLRRYDEQLERRAIVTVTLVRSFTYLPPAADWFFGVSRIRVRQFVVGTAVGIVPPTVVIVLAGEGITRWVGDGGPSVVIAGAALAAVLPVALLVRRRVLRRRASEVREADGSMA